MHQKLKASYTRSSRPHTLLAQGLIYSNMHGTVVHKTNAKLIMKIIPNYEGAIKALRHSCPPDVLIFVFAEEEERKRRATRATRAASPKTCFT